MVRLVPWVVFFAFCKVVVPPVNDAFWKELGPQRSGCFLSLLGYFLSKLVGEKLPNQGINTIFYVVVPFCSLTN